jgi:hypothetical protein
MTSGVWYGPGSAKQRCALHRIRETSCSRLAHRELQHLDGVEVLHAAADALCGVEQPG